MEMREINMPSAIQVKKWQETVSIEEQLDVISCLEKR
jgi:hypothetical protein